MDLIRAAVLTLFTVSVASPHALQSQPATGTLTGRVTEQGGPLPGINVILTSPALQGTRTTMTSANGEFSFAFLPPGDYKVVFSLSGFKQVQRSATVGPGQAARLEVDWQLGRVFEEIVPPARARIGEAYWNGWLREQGMAAQAPRVERGRSYDVNFDLAPYRYDQRAGIEAGTTDVDTAFRRALARATGGRLPITVKPFLLGHGLEFTAGRAQTQSVEVRLARLRKPATNFAPKDPLNVFADKVNALRVTVGVNATEAGCAAVGLSIWNAALNAPLDYVVHRIAVTDPKAPGSPRACGGAAKEKALTGRLVSLLAGQTGEVADAALHVFDISVPGSPLTSTAVFLQKGRPEALSWKLPQPLSQFVGLQAFLNDLKIARRIKSYRELSRELTSALFPTETDYAGSTAADEAMKALRTLAANKGAGTRRFLSRLVDAEGRSFFLPLGLLDLGGGTLLAQPLLAQSVIVRQPLPHEEPASAGRCVATWTMLLPDDMGEELVEKEYLTRVEGSPRDGATSLAELKRHLAIQPSAGARGEGLLLLGHHSAGFLKTGPSEPETLLASDIRRKFPPGSVAVLAACATGQLGGDNRRLPLVTQLSQKGLQAALLSPFPLDGPFGARFALHFAHEVDRARSEKEEADLGALFQRTVEAVRKERSDVFPDQAYEFVLAGDSSIRLCK